VITIADTGFGNLRSIQNMLRRAGVDSTITADLAVVRDAKKLILPGVGAFDAGMERLRSLEMVDALREKALVDKVPLLGICLGAQLLFEKSEEGTSEGLGLVPGSVVRFQKERLGAELRIPHMGWSEVVQKKPSVLFEGMVDHPRFYFVHSFHFAPSDATDVLCTCDHGDAFPAAVERGNVYGVQFHPEKSHKFGMKLLENFAKIPT
jgi:glutamine amidotransferase